MEWISSPTTFSAPYDPEVLAYSKRASGFTKAAEEPFYWWNLYNYSGERLSYGFGLSSHLTDQWNHQNNYTDSTSLKALTHLR